MFSTQLNATTFTCGSNYPHLWKSLFSLILLEHVTGEEVCVSCESKASRPHLGDRCSGHGVDGKMTRLTPHLHIFPTFLSNISRFKNVITPGCHGRWTRVDVYDSCPCKDGPHFIFV